MNVNSLVWVKNPDFKDPSNDFVWVPSVINEKHLTANLESVAFNVKLFGKDYVVKMDKAAVESDSLKPRDSDDIAGIEDIQYLKHINEPEVIHLLKARYEAGHIFTYSGGVLMYLNPFDQVEVNDSSHHFLEDFIRKIVISLSNRPDTSNKSAGGNGGGSGKSVTRAKSMYAMSAGTVNNEKRSNKNVVHKDSIIISGESGSGKSECYKMIMHTLLESTTTIDAATIEDLKSRSANLMSGSGESPFSSPHHSLRKHLSTKISATKSLELPDDHPVPNDAILEKTNSFAAHLQLSSTHTELVEKILLANRILESFGNAHTLHTVDSSRFAKFIELIFIPKESPSYAKRRPFGGEIIAATIKTFLLESSRTSTQQLHERNFNIFYEFLSGWSNEEKLKYGLVGNSSDYYYTNQGEGNEGHHHHHTLISVTTGIPLDELHHDYHIDSEKFYQLNDSFLSLNFSARVIQEIYQIIGGILMLGEINLTESGEIALSEKMLMLQGMTNPLTSTSKLFGIEEENLKLLLTAKTLYTPNGDVIKLNLTPEQSRISRDGIVKQIYKNLFDFIVEEINQKLEEIVDSHASSSNHPSNSGSMDSVEKRQQRSDRMKSLRSLIILDIFGFDSFEKNSIDQLCINYANEAMQQQFNSYIFTKEIEFYQKEGLVFEKLEYSDNKDNLDLISNGIFRVLDDQCRLPHPTDKRFLARIYKDFENHPLFAVSKLQSGRNQFTILHYAGSVEYTGDDFIEKNIDNTPPETNRILSESSNEVLCSIYEQILTNEATALAAAGGGGGGGGGEEGRGSMSGPPQKRGSVINRTNPTLTGQFKTELTFLLKEIEATLPHYIRCIKPTNIDWIEKKAPERYWFSQSKVSDQLKYCGIMEGYRFTKSKISFLEFYNRYRLIASTIFANASHLPYYLWDGTEREFQFPNKYATTALAVSTPEEIRQNCIDLLELFTIHQDQMSKSGGAGGAPLSPAAASSLVKASNALGSKFVKPQLKKSFSRKSMGKSMKVAPLRTAKAGLGASSLYNMNIVNFDVDVYLAADGIINAKQIAVGKTKIFLPQKEHDYLEVCRSSCLTHLANLIYNNYIAFIYRRYFTAAKKAVRIIQKKFRNIHARQMRISRWRAVLALQRNYRKKSFFKKIVKMQCCFRMMYARSMFRYLMDQKEMLLKTYGQFIVARDMRMARRTAFSRSLEDEAAAGEETQAVSVPAMMTTTKQPVLIPSLEKRLQDYSYQEDSLTRAITSISSNAAEGGDTTVAISPTTSVDEYEGGASSGGEFSVSSEVGDEDDPRFEQLKFFSSMLGKTNHVLGKNKTGNSPSMEFPQLMKYFDICISLLPSKPTRSSASSTAADDGVISLKDTLLSRLAEMKAKGLKCYRVFHHAGKLLNPDALVDFSLIGKYMGLKVWKITVSKSQQEKQTSELKITKQHPLFDKIYWILTQIQALHEFVQAILTPPPSSNGHAPSTQVILPGGVPAHLMMYRNPRKNRRLFNILEELSFCCGEFTRYYEDYVNFFCREYGDRSSFATAFAKSSSAYLYSLLNIIKMEKKYDRSAFGVNPKGGKGNNGGINGEQASSSDPSAHSPLILEWSTEHPFSPSSNKADVYAQALAAKRKAFAAADASMMESDTLKKLELVDSCRRDMTAYNLRIIEYNGFSYHYMPAAPSYEYAINSFHSLLSGEIPKMQKLFKVLGNRSNLGKIAYYSISSNIISRSNNGAENGADSSHTYHNNSLMDVLYDPVSIEMIESLSFSTAIITCCVLGLLQLQPNHMMIDYERRSHRLQPMNISEKKELAHLLSNQPEASNIKLLAFNGDFSVYNGFLNYRNPYYSKLHQNNVNVLFMLPQMDEPLNKHLKNFFLSSPFFFEELMVNWLRDIYDQNNRYVQLLKRLSLQRTASGKRSTDPSQFSEKDFENLSLPLKLPKGSLTEMMKRLKHLLKVLKDSDSDDSMVLTPSLLFHEFYPLLADFYADVRNNSDFKENINMDGVVSYAYAYHNTVSTLANKYPKLASLSCASASFDFHSSPYKGGSIDESDSGAGAPKQFYPKNNVASSVVTFLRKNQLLKAGVETASAYHKKKGDEKDGKALHPELGGWDDESFWNKVEYVDGADDEDLLSPNNAKRRHLRKGVDDPQGFAQKKNQQQRTTPGGGKKGNDFNTPPNSKKTQSVRFGDSPPPASSGKGVLTKQKSAYVGYDNVYEAHDEVNDGGNPINEEGKARHPHPQRRSHSDDHPDGEQRKQPSADFEHITMGELYEQNELFDAPESLFIIDTNPAEYQKMAKSLSTPMVNYESIYEVESNFSMGSNIVLSPMPSSRGIGGGQSSERDDAIPIDIYDEDDPRRTQALAANRQRSVNPSFRFNDVYGEDGKGEFKGGDETVDESSQGAKGGKKKVGRKIEGEFHEESPLRGGGRSRTSNGGKENEGLTDNDSKSSSEEARAAVNSADRHITPFIPLKDRLLANNGNNILTPSSASPILRRLLAAEEESKGGKKGGAQKRTSINKLLHNQMVQHDQNSSNREMNSLNRKNTFLTEEEAQAAAAELEEQQRLLLEKQQSPQLPKSFFPPKRSTMVAGDVEMVSIVDEISDFVASIDFKAIRESYAKVSPDYKMDHSLKYCKILGKNFSFLKTMTLVNISPDQLKVMFKYFIKTVNPANNNNSALADLALVKNKIASTVLDGDASTSAKSNKSTFSSSRIRLELRELVLKYDSKEELTEIKKSSVLYYLRKDYLVDIKLVWTPGKKRGTGEEKESSAGGGAPERAASPNSKTSFYNNSKVVDISGVNPLRSNRTPTKSLRIDDKSYKPAQGEEVIYYEIDEMKPSSPKRMNSTSGGLPVIPKLDETARAASLDILSFDEYDTATLALKNSNISSKSNKNKASKKPATPGGDAMTTDDDYDEEEKGRGGENNYEGSSTLEELKAEELKAFSDLKERLLKILLSCSNLMSMSVQRASPRNASSTSSAAQLSAQESKLKIDAVKNVITYLTTPSIHRYQPIDSALFSFFEQIVLEYPSLAPIALLLVEKNAFKNNILYVNKLLESKYLDRFVELVLAIIFKHPDVLVSIDTQGMLPCDHIKAISLSDSSRGKFKHYLLWKIINFSGEMNQRYLQTMTRPGQGHGIFSSYREEEELIILGTHYDFPASQLEIASSQYCLEKKDKFGISILLKLILKELYGMNEEEKDLAKHTFDLVLKCLHRRKRELLASSAQGITPRSTGAGSLSSTPVNSPKSAATTVDGGAGAMSDDEKEKALLLDCIVIKDEIVPLINNIDWKYKKNVVLEDSVIWKRFSSQYPEAISDKIRSYFDLILTISA